MSDYVYRGTGRDRLTESKTQRQIDAETAGDRDTARLMELERSLAATGVIAPENAPPYPRQPPPQPPRGAAPAGVRDVPISAVVPNPANIRDEIGDVSELAASMRAHGILQPLIVEPRPDGRLTLIAGHRRLAAARLAGLTTVRVDVRPQAGPAQTTVLMLIENCHRAGVSAMEKAEALGQLKNKHRWSSAYIALQTGFAPGTVSRYLALLELDPATRQRVKDGTVTVGAALSAVRDARAQARRSPAPRPPGSAVKPRPAPKPVRLEPKWWTLDHPQAAAAALTCDHDNRPRTGGVACGPCWEDAIRADERARVASQARAR